MPRTADPPEGLDALEARLRQDLAWLAAPPPRWTPETQRKGREVHDVSIIGAGMAGLAAAFALRLQGLSPVLFDSAPRDQEGPWVTIARMKTLRSPKHLTGPALDIPSLTFRAWYEAQFGEAAWKSLDKIPRQQWMQYLCWYRRVLALDVRNEHTLTGIELHDDHVALSICHAGVTQSVLARRVVLALGMDAFGGPSLPSFVEGVPKQYWSHTAEAPDYASLTGRRVAVVGGSASAMDAAATSLEAGARSVELLIRRPDFPRINRTKAVVGPGVEQGYYALPDDWKWQLAHGILQEQIAPPHGSTLRVSRHKNVRFNFGCAVERLDVQPEGYLVVTTPRNRFQIDHLILATGYQLDWALRPEFAALALHVRRWGDAYQPPVDQQHAQLAEYPYLNADFSFQPRHDEAPRGLSRVHCFSYPASLSNGNVIGLIMGISQGARSLAQAIAAHLFVEDQDHHFQRIMAYDDPELWGDEWSPADPL